MQKLFILNESEIKSEVLNSGSTIFDVQPDLGFDFEDLVVYDLINPVHKVWKITSVVRSAKAFQASHCAFGARALSEDELQYTIQQLARRNTTGWYEYNRDDSAMDTAATELLSVLNANDIKLDTVVDASCGMGFPLSKALITMFNEYIGIDNNPQMCLNLMKSSPHNDIICSDFLSAEMEKKADVVVFLYSLHYFTQNNIGRVLDKARSFLNENGKIVALVKMERKPIQYGEDWRNTPTLWCELGAVEYVRIAAHNGFEVKRVNCKFNKDYTWFTMSRSL